MQLFFKYFNDDDDDLDDYDVGSFNSQLPLVQACFHGDADEVRALIYKKEDVNTQVGETLHLCS